MEIIVTKIQYCSHIILYEKLLISPIDFPINLIAVQMSRVSSNAGTVVSVSCTLKNINLNIFNKIFNLCPGALWLFYGEGVPVRLDRFNCHSD